MAICLLSPFILFFSLSFLPFDSFKCTAYEAFANHTNIRLIEYELREYWFQLHTTASLHHHRYYCDERHTCYATPNYKKTNLLTVDQPVKLRCGRMKGCVQLMQHGGIECDREAEKWTKKTQQIALTSYAILCYRRQASNATQFYVCTLYVVRAMILHFHFFVRWCVVIGLCSFYEILGFGYFVCLSMHISNQSPIRIWNIFIRFIPNFIFGGDILRAQYLSFLFRLTPDSKHEFAAHELRHTSIRCRIPGTEMLPFRWRLPHSFIRWSVIPLHEVYTSSVFNPLFSSILFLCSVDLSARERSHSQHTKKMSLSSRYQSHVAVFTKRLKMKSKINI